MLNFDFLKKGLGIVSPSHFVYEFSRKMFLMLYFINWPNFIAWLPLLLEILVNMSIAILCKPGCDVINFEINLIFLFKPFFYITKKSRQKELLRWKKAFFIIFKGAIQKNVRSKIVNFKPPFPLLRYPTLLCVRTFYVILPSTLSDILFKFTTFKNKQKWRTVAPLLWMERLKCQMCSPLFWSFDHSSSSSDSHSDPLPSLSISNSFSSDLRWQFFVVWLLQLHSANIFCKAYICLLSAFRALKDSKDQMALHRVLPLPLEFSLVEASW